MINSSSLPRCSPEEQGVNSEYIDNFIRDIKVNELSIRSFMFLRHGFVVAEGWWSPYSSEQSQMVFSISKSFTSTAIGLAISENLLSLEDAVISFFQEELPNEISGNLVAMKIKHLLTMTTGHSKDTIRAMVMQQEGNWVKGFLKEKVEYTPGTKFLYSDGASYMLSAIIQKVTGQTVADYLKNRVLFPLGIEEFIWETCPKGINKGGFGLNLTTEDIAKFGQLYLQKGIYNNQRILPESWIEEATSCQSVNDNDKKDYNCGYGFHFWRCRHNAYRAEGALGQFCIVMPDYDAVIVITGSIDKPQLVLDLVWKHLLQSMSTQETSYEFNASSKTIIELQNLEIQMAEAHSNSLGIEKISNKTYKLEENELKIENVSLNFIGEECNLKIKDSRGEHVIRCGSSRWISGKSDFLERPMIRGNSTKEICSRGVWIDNDKYITKWVFVETPIICTLTWHFDSDQVYIEYSSNVSFGQNNLFHLKGHVIS